MFCFDTDVLSNLLRPVPRVALVRRLARTAAADQATTAITLGELNYGAARIGATVLADQIAEIVSSALVVLPFDEEAAHRFGVLKASLEHAGTRLSDPELRIAAIVLARDLTLVTGNVRHFARVPDLRVENWLD